MNSALGTSHDPLVSPDPERLPWLLARVVGDEDYRDLQLDADLTEALLGATIEWRTANYTMERHPVACRPSKNHVGGVAREPVSRLTGSLDAAVGLLVRCLPPTYHWCVSQPGYIEGVCQGGRPVCRIDHPLSSGGGPAWAAAAPTLPRCVVAATLTTLQGLESRTR